MNVEVLAYLTSYRPKSVNQVPIEEYVKDRWYWDLHMGVMTGESDSRKKMILLFDISYAFIFVIGKYRLIVLWDMQLGIFEFFLQ